ncbi:DNA gyrase inhibitor YacG [Vitreoscilla filiformis]|jgi:endogenous inhibitor of DNA gyrase (YacG/DUF329 family)|uniref:DNA gyrase inhibitor YacG n=1 Tax=Vitreoscilla filiformis TaxID=63 RepID=UPI000B7A91A0|nr:DNA gyrase inhibitor YacG [Vitreoscilla filiformis]
MPPQLRPPAQPLAAPVETVRRVSCPRCGQSARYASDNPWRPFCSERCQKMDLGAWASEDYRVATSPPTASDD